MTRKKYSDNRPENWEGDWEEPEPEEEEPIDDGPVLWNLGGTYVATANSRGGHLYLTLTKL